MDEQYDTLLTVALAVVAVGAWRYTPRIIAGVPFLAPPEVKQRLDSGDFEVVIDVRSPEEFAGPAGHIPGAVNLPFDAIARRMAEIAAQIEPFKDLPVVVTCSGEQRSPHATRRLKKAGFRNLRVLKGGMKGWKRAGLPVEIGYPAAAETQAPEPATES